MRHKLSNTCSPHSAAVGAPRALRLRRRIEATPSVATADRATITALTLGRYDRAEERLGSDRTRVRRLPKAARTRHQRRLRAPSGNPVAARLPTAASADIVNFSSRPDVTRSGRGRHRREAWNENGLTVEVLSGRLSRSSCAKVTKNIQTWDPTEAGCPGDCSPITQLGVGEVESPRAVCAKSNGAQDKQAGLDSFSSWCPALPCPARVGPRRNGNVPTRPR